jgi:hypothetical protein
MTPLVLLGLFIVIICGVVSNTSVGYGHSRRTLKLKRAKLRYATDTRD